MNVRSKFTTGLAAALLLFVAAPKAFAESSISWMLPENVSTYGGKIDSLFIALVWLTGAAFAAVVISLLYFCLRYRAQEGKKAEYTHGNSFKAMAVTGTLALLVFVGIDMNVVRMSNAAAKELYAIPKDNALRVQVLAQQFSWGFRFPGPDGKFGRCDFKKADSTNIFGIDENDPDGKDDVVTEGALSVPVGVPVVLEMRAKDVIHSFFLPHFRVKQDVVPGMTTSMWFQATRTGEFEIACAELCGMLHSKMGGVMTVRDQAGFENWLKERAP
jgi:cytochrome c oxidase subunit II